MGLMRMQFRVVYPERQTMFFNTDTPSAARSRQRCIASKYAKYKLHHILHFHILASARLLPLQTCYAVLGKTVARDAPHITASFG